MATINKMKQFKRLITAVMAFAVMLTFSGCSFETYVRTKQRPEDALRSFVECLKNEQYDECSAYLTNGSSFKLNNQTGFDFTEKMLHYRLEKLTYVMVKAPTKGKDTSDCIIIVTAPDIGSVRADMASRYAILKAEYVKTNDIAVFPSDDNQLIEQLAWQAFVDVTEKLTEEKSELVINFKYENSKWKMVSDDALCEAFFGSNLSGGNENE